MHFLKFTFLLFVATSCFAADKIKLNSAEIYVIQAYEHAEEAYIVRYVNLSKSKKLSMDMVNITADIEKVLKGSRKAYSQIEFYRLYDDDIGEQTYLEGQNFIVLYTQIAGKLTINPQDPMSVIKFTPELEEVFSRLGIKHN